ncbi:MAG: lasso peptide biosynthesis B2 protein [Acidobacteriota bacterium]
MGLSPMRLWSLKLSRLRAWSRRDQWLLLRAVLLIAVVAAAVRMGGVARVQRMLGRLSRPSGTSAVHAAEAHDVARIVHAASRHTLANTCLHRSLALWFLLRRQGHEVELRYGARKRDGRFEAHAWVEVDGCALNDDESVDRDFAPLSWPPLNHDT